LNSRFKNTNGLEIAEKVIRKFEQSNQQIKYKSNFEVFALESNLEDFLGEYSTDTIFVSTMHKAKGIRICFEYCYARQNRTFARRNSYGGNGCGKTCYIEVMYFIKR
jgi:hypothetical protein